MTKNYFIAFSGHNKSGDLITGHAMMRVSNESLPNICQKLAESRGLVDPCVITFMRDMSDEEFNMLLGDNPTEE